MKKVGIVFNPTIEAAVTLTGELGKYLSGEGVSNWECSSWEIGEDLSEMEGTDLVLSVGGDGTILRAIQAVAASQTPVTGINLGKLGFMTELAADEALARLPEILNGAGWIDERTMLEVQVTGDGGEERHYYALNDLVVARGAIARMVSVDVNIDNEPFTAYRADGVLVATATGSTGYSLAAGGPVLNPQASEFLLLPILPHLCLSYPLVLPASTVVSLRVSTAYQATLSIDGNINFPLSSDTLITVKRSQTSARFWRIHSETSFYRTLGKKLKAKK
jgi:NAD+ kinase